MYFKMNVSIMKTKLIILLLYTCCCIHLAAQQRAKCYGPVTISANPANRPHFASKGEAEEDEEEMEREEAAENSFCSDNEGQNKRLDRAHTHISYLDLPKGGMNTEGVSNPCNDFEGVADDILNAGNPPDTYGAVGPQHVVSTTNMDITIRDKSGNMLPGYPLVGIGNFFANPNFTVTPLDVRVLYDSYADRWIITALNCMVCSSGANIDLLIAVSQTGDPTSTWSIYGFNIFANNSGWLDQPRIGINKNWIIVTGNPISGNGVNPIILCNKVQIYSGLPTSPYIFTNALATSDAIPSITYDNTTNKAYIVEFGSSSQLYVYEINGTVGTPTISAPHIVSIGGQTWGGGGGTYPQLGGNLSIDSDWNNYRVKSVVYRNGSLWVVNGVANINGAVTSASILWWQIRPNNNYSVSQFGKITDPTGSEHYVYPSISVNAMEDVMVGYTIFRGDIYPSAAYSFRKAGDPPHTMQAPYIYKYGGVHFPQNNLTHSRWGDYSATVTDPNEVGFWTVQETCRPIAGVLGWSTWWACKQDETDMCPVFFDLHAPIQQTLHYTASDYISSSTTILTGSDIGYKAGIYIDILPGFEVDNNSIFDAQILGCGIPRMANPHPTTEHLNATNPTQSIICYPNPTNGEIYFDFDHETIGNIKIELYDIQGKIVFQQATQSPEGDTHLSTDISPLQTGIYFWKITTQTRIYTGKIAKTN